MKITNEKEVMAKIDIATDKVLEARTMALHILGQQGVTFLKQQSPVETGRLRGSMSYSIDKQTTSPEPHQTNISKDFVGKNDRKDMVVIGTNVVYAPAVEYRQKKGTDKDKSIGFFNRAVNLLRQNAEKLLSEEIKKRLAG